MTLLLLYQIFILNQIVQKIVINRHLLTSYLQRYIIKSQTSFH